MTRSGAAKFVRLELMFIFADPGHYHTAEQATQTHNGPQTILIFAGAVVALLLVAGAVYYVRHKPPKGRQTKKIISITLLTNLQTCV